MEAAALFRGGHNSGERWCAKRKEKKKTDKHERQTLGCVPVYILRDIGGLLEEERKGGARESNSAYSYLGPILPPFPSYHKPPIPPPSYSYPPYWNSTGTIHVSFLLIR